MDICMSLLAQPSCITYADSPVEVVQVKVYLLFNRAHVCALFQKNRLICSYVYHTHLFNVTFLNNVVVNLFLCSSYTCGPSENQDFLVLARALAL